MSAPTIASSLPLGDGAPEFGELPAVDGTRYRLASFDDSAVLAVVFICNGCPTVRVYDQRLIALQERYASLGVQVVAINSNNPYLSPADTYPEMVKKAKNAGYNFPYLQDEEGGVARKYGAVSTPHAFVFDGDRRLRYRGRIDDSRDPARVTSFDLDRALAAVLEDRPVGVPETQPFGCAIVR
jgi:thiol-disulfide isomerase/thioredoxin